MDQRKRTRFNRIVLRHLGQARGSLTFAAACMLGVTLTQVLSPWPLKVIFDHILLAKPLRPSLAFLAGLLQQGKGVALVLFSLSIVAIAALRGMFSYFQLFLTSRIGYQLTHALRRELFSHLQALSLSFYSHSRAGELLARITTDTQNVRDVFTEAAFTFTADLLTVVGTFVVMFAVNWQLGLVVLATFPLLFGSLWYLYQKIKASAREQRKKEGMIAARISEVVTAMLQVQAFGRERLEEERFETESVDTVEEGIRTARLEAAATRTVEVINAVGTGAAVLFGGFLVLEGRLLPGELLVFTSYLTTMYRPVRNLARFSTKISKAAVSAERIAEILDLEPEIQDAPDALEAPPLRGEIVFDQVSFRYGTGRRVLKAVSFRLPPGQRVAVVGVSGAGKSTLVSLLLRFYDPQAGTILIDGVPLPRYRRESLRRQIALVLQDSVLFGASIRENIAYGKPEATEAEIVAAAQAAHAHAFIVGLKDGYDTVLGERGATLSGGQRQRLAIARALIRNAPILILDEPMTGLDVESEAQVRAALRRLMAGRTCLLITHDLQAVSEADLVLVLEGGRIVEQGGPQALLAQSPRYRQLHALQAGQRGVSQPV